MDYTQLLFTSGDLCIMIRILSKKYLYDTDDSSDEEPIWL